MRRIICILGLLLAVPLMAGNGYIYHVNEAGHCDAMTPQASFACFEKEWGEDETNEFTYVPFGDPDCNQQRIEGVYCILSRDPRKGGKWSDSLGNVIGRRAQICQSGLIRNNGSSDGVPIPEQYEFTHYMRAPKGKNAGEWYPDSFKKCEDNCTVQYKVR